MPDAGNGVTPGGDLIGGNDPHDANEIADSAFTYQVALEKGDKRVVGVNSLTGDIGEPLEIRREGTHVAHVAFRRSCIRQLQP